MVAKSDAHSRHLETMRGQSIDRRLSVWAVIFVCVVGCAAPRSVSVATAAVVNGVVEPGYPSVYMLTNRSGRCTASLIAPRVVLSAWHCVVTNADDPNSRALPASDFHLQVADSSGRATGTTYNVASIHILDAPVDIGNASPASGGKDIALLVLTAAAAETPVRLGRADPAMLAGTMVTAVGFGKTNTDDRNDRKYRGSNTVIDASSSPGLIRVNPITCQGDSGGPVFGSDGMQYGTTSYGYSTNGANPSICGAVPTAFNALHRHFAWIDGVVAPYGWGGGGGTDAGVPVDSGTPPPTDSGTPRPDSGTPIPSSGIGTRCGQGSNNCPNGLVCRDSIRGFICTQSCAARRPQQSCPYGAYCSASGGSCDGLCLPGTQGAQPIGAECRDDLECVSNYCHEVSRGFSVCLDRCQGDHLDCLAGEVCTAPSGDTCGGCMPRILFSGLRGLGETCGSNAQCRSELCDGIRQKECTVTCDETQTCPGGFYCRQGICIVDRRQPVGFPCADDFDCGALRDGLCILGRPGVRWCTTRCGENSEECPPGTECIPIGSRNLCAPVLAMDGEACFSDFDCISNFCVVNGIRRVCASQCNAERHCSQGFLCARTADGLSAVCVRPNPVAPVCQAHAVGSGTQTSHASQLWTLTLLTLMLVRSRSIRKR